MTSNKVGCAGILVSDTFCGPMPALPREGQLLAVDALPTKAGGCAANVAIDLVKQGIEVEIAGCLGNDPSARVLLASLAEYGIQDRRLVYSDQLPTSKTVILLVEGEDRRYIHSFGANAAFRVSDIDRRWVGGLKVFYLGGLFLMLAKAEHAVTNRAFTGIPSLAVAPKGRLWATWYAGVTPGEDLNNYVVLSTSGDNGATWTEVLIVDPDAGGPVRSFDPELWVSPDGRLFHFWAKMDKSRRDAELGVWCIETSEPDAAQPKWSAPRRIGDGVMMCKPLVLSSGEWVLPISRWGADESAQCFVSTDAGQTWTRRGGCNVPKDSRNADEHMFVERRDGSLWLLVRTNYGIGKREHRPRQHVAGVEAFGHPAHGLPVFHPAARLGESAAREARPARAAPNQTEEVLPGFPL